MRTSLSPNTPPILYWLVAVLPAGKPILPVHLSLSAPMTQQERLVGRTKYSPVFPSYTLSGMMDSDSEWAGRNRDKRITSQVLLW